MFDKLHSCRKRRKWRMQTYKEHKFQPSDQKNHSPQREKNVFLDWKKLYLQTWFYPLTAIYLSTYVMYKAGWKKTGYRIAALYSKNTENFIFSNRFPRKSARCAKTTSTYLRFFLHWLSLIGPIYRCASAAHTTGQWSERNKIELLYTFGRHCIEEVLFMGHL